MPRVSAALRDEVDIATEGAAELSLAPARHDLNCSMASTPNVIPLSPATSSLAETPSTMKLLERLRWLAILNRPCPGTAEVSAKSCVLFAFVGDTPGTSMPRPRYNRGRSSRQVLNFRLANRTRDLAARGLEHVAVSNDGHGGIDTRDFQGDRNIECQPALNTKVRAFSSNPWRVTLS